MDRRSRLNLVLLAIAGLLSLIVMQSLPPELPSLTPLEPGGIEQIEITDLAGRHIRLDKQPGGWMSGQATADGRRVEQLLGLSRTPSLHRFQVPADLAPFGLDPAAIRLRFDTLTMEFGATDPVNGWRYVRIGNEIHLIADGFYHHLTAPPQAWLEAP